MRVGIYNRWLATLGGGEKHSLGIAEYISRKHPVTVISHKPVSKVTAARSLNLDLSRVTFSLIPNRSVEHLSSITADYDLFINASHLDFFPSVAQYSVMLVYFPAPLGLERVLRWGRRLKLMLRRWLMIPAFTTGVYSLDALEQTQVRLTDSNLTVELPAHPRGYSLRFSLASYCSKLQQVRLSLDGDPLGVIDLSEQSGYHTNIIEIPESLTGEFHVLRVESIDERLQDVGTSVAAPSNPARMQLAHFYIDHPRYRLYQRLFEQMFPRLGLELHYIPPTSFSILDSVDTYDTIWANSGFTQKWIRKYWRRKSSILYPPVDVDDFRPGHKKKYILNVGRFFAGNHNKKHLVLIEAFKEMVENGLTEWELHLAGGAMKGEEHRRYQSKVAAASRDYPVTIHQDLPYQELVKLYSQSSIYWHASGFGESERRNPDKFEHFGITTVEAMSAGCVPVVIGKGGQPEIVAHGINGYLWNTTEELKYFTTELIGNPETLEKLSRSAVERSHRYSKHSFEQRLQKLLPNIL